MAIQDTIILFIVRFWWTLPLLAVVMFLLILDIMRRINNRILYIRSSRHGGGTLEFIKCTQQGTNLEFFPQKGDKQVAHIESDPYLWVKGT
ncbi:unnamed protein product, partial [marine sediment metagenome]